MRGKKVGSPLTSHIVQSWFPLEDLSPTRQDLVQRFAEVGS
jgi:hypothetical protein